MDEVISVMPRIKYRGRYEVSMSTLDCIMYHVCEYASMQVSYGVGTVGG